MTMPRGAPPTLLVALCLVALGPAVVSLANAQGPASAQSAQAGAPAWQSLTPAQRQVLQPLAAQWGDLPASSREKWLQVAVRYPKLTATEQQRLRERMNQWASLPATERGEARLRFQQARQLSPAERQQKWEAYQALSAEDRDQLGRQARQKADPAGMATSAAPSAPSQSSRRLVTADGRKANVVPAAGQRRAPAPTVVAPALIKEGPGATTRLVTQPATPPLHQQAGLPKITATRVFVDPVTLLPRKGAQGAGMGGAMPADRDHDLPD